MRAAVTSECNGKSKLLLVRSTKDYKVAGGLSPDTAETVCRVINNYLDQYAPKTPLLAPEGEGEVKLVSDIESRESSERSSCALQSVMAGEPVEPNAAGSLED